MSGSYVNAAEAAEAAANSSRPPRPSRRTANGSGVTSCPSASSTLCSSTVMSSAAATATAGQQRMTRQSSRTVVQQRRHHQNHQQQHQRPRSEVSQRFSQVYDMAVHGRPAFLHRAAVTPALWLLCQTVLVVLSALCCAFLINRPVDSRNSQPWIRLEFAQGKEKQYIFNTTANKPYGELICSKRTGELMSQHCEDMKHHFELRTSSDGTAIIVKRGTVYRINAAVTFRRASAGIFREVDVSVQINNETWISCQEGITGRYVHCSLFGMQYLPMGSVVTFSSSRSGWRIASHSGVTFFDIEMRF